jgi:glycosyltransferase involved in cell wall biosynthesis
VRIYYDHQLTSLQDAGGASRYHYELAAYMATQPDTDTTLFLGFCSTTYPYRELPSNRIKVTSFPPVISKGARRYALNEALANTAAIFAGAYDIYHPSHHRILPFVRSRRVVVNHHDCTYERFPGFRFTERVLRAKRKLFPRADRIICISESGRRDLLDFYRVEPERTAVIHLGFTRLSRSPLAATEFATHLRRDFVLYVGSRPHYKNFDRLLEAFASAGLRRDFDLLVLGGGPLSEVHRALIQRLGLTGSIVALPIVSDEILAEAYSTARLFAYPSLWEGFGLPPLEAMFLRCPVAASHVAAIPEISGDAPLYFDPNDISSIAATLVKGLYDTEARAHAVARGEEVASQYSWEKCASQTLALYRECL